MGSDDHMRDGGAPVDSGVFYASGEGGDRSRLPDQIGPYRIEKKLGQGGMGVVYLASQSEPIRRQVALKLVKLGMDTEQVVARFRSERQAMAVMDHPGIARVFDAGATDLGRPYFVMEYVQGVPVTTYCDEQRLNTTERLRLFVEVCHAVQHAHQKGVIHRDLKPSNVLVTEVDGRPQPKIIDFGIAKATEGGGVDLSRHTMAGQFVGTPEYMSPEQVSGNSADVDTRSDVYALGVILYELLVGARPLDLRCDLPDSIEIMRRRIREEEPPRPSTRVTELGDRGSKVADCRGSDPDSLRVLLRGDLDWIVMKAMEKEPARRYASASEFAADVCRFLDCEPVRAAPPSAQYRLRKFVRRNRGLVAAAGMFAGLLVVATIVSLMLFLRAEDARQAAELNATELSKANEFLATANARVEEEAGRVELVNTFLTDMLFAPDPDQDGRDVKVVDLLDDVSASIDTSFADNELMRGTLHDTVGMTYHGLGLYVEAQDHLKRAHEAYVTAVGEEDRLSIVALSNIGRSQQSAGFSDEAMVSTERALELSSRVLGDLSAETITLHNTLGVIHLSAGEYDESREHLQRSLDLSRELFGEHHKQTATAMLNLGQLHYTLGQVEEAEPYHKAAWEIRRDVLGARHTSTLNAMSNYALVLIRGQDAAEAEQILRELLPLSREVRGETHPSTMLATNNLAGALWVQGKLDGLEVLLRETLDAQLEQLGEDHEATLTTMHNLGSMYHRLERSDDAERLLRRAHVARARFRGAEHVETAMTASALAATLLVQEETAEAADLYEAAVGPLESVLGAENDRTIQARLGAASTRLELGDVDAAAAHMALLGEAGLEISKSVWIRAQIDLAEGREAEARAGLLSLLARPQAAGGADTWIERARAEVEARGWAEEDIEGAAQ